MKLVSDEVASALHGARAKVRTLGASRELSMVATKIDEALLWLGAFAVTLAGYETPATQEICRQFGFDFEVD